MLACKRHQSSLKWGLCDVVLVIYIDGSHGMLSMTNLLVLDDGMGGEEEEEEEETNKCRVFQNLGYVCHKPICLSLPAEKSKMSVPHKIAPSTLLLKLEPLTNHEASMKSMLTAIFLTIASHAERSRVAHSCCSLVCLMRTIYPII